MNMYKSIKNFGKKALLVGGLVAVLSGSSLGADLGQLLEVEFSLREREDTIQRFEETIDLFYDHTDVNFESYTEQEALMLDSDKVIQIMQASGLIHEFQDTLASCFYRGNDTHEAIKKIVQDMLQRNLNGTTILHKEGRLSFVNIAHEMTHISQMQEGKENGYSHGYLNNNEIESFIDSMIVFRYTRLNSSFYDFAREQDSVSELIWSDKKVEAIISLGTTHLTLEHKIWDDLVGYGNISIDNVDAIRKTLRQKYFIKSEKPLTHISSSSKSKREADPRIQLVYQAADDVNLLSTTDPGILRDALFAYFREYATLLPHIHDEKTLDTFLPQAIPVAKQIFQNRDYQLMCNDPVEFMKNYSYIK